MNTLEDLITKCSDGHQRFRWLKNHKTTWLAQARAKDVKDKDIKAIGKTPREAMEKLLELLTKEHATTKE